MDALHRRLARRIPATVVGTANAERYARGGSRVHAMAPSLVRASDVVELGARRPLPRTDAVAERLLTLPLFGHMTDEQVDRSRTR